MNPWSFQDLFRLQLALFISLKMNLYFKVILKLTWQEVLGITIIKNENTMVVRMSKKINRFISL